jgi:hypothetical protein
LTVLDLAKWDAALDSEKLLKRASLDSMWTPGKIARGLAALYDADLKPVEHTCSWIRSARSSRAQRSNEALPRQWASRARMHGPGNGSRCSSRRDLMKKQVTKLVLSKETLRGLEGTELVRVAGCRPSEQILPRPGFCTEGVSCLC